MFARARIRLAEKAGARVLPRDCLVLKEGKTGVFLVRDKVAVFQEVETGLKGRDEVEITSPLDPAIPVVLKGMKDIRDGARVDASDRG
jgi:hypothetical protein